MNDIFNSGYSDYSGYLGYSGYVDQSANTMQQVMLISMIIFLVIGIVVVALFLPMRNAGKYKGFPKALYNFFNFNVFWLSPIIKIFYIGILGACIVTGFYVMFADSFWQGLILIASGFIMRILFEMTMLFLNIRDQIVKTNWYLSKLTGEKAPDEKQDSTSYESQSKAQENEQTVKYCLYCGGKINDGEVFCVNCGKPVNK